MFGGSRRVVSAAASTPWSRAADLGQVVITTTLAVGSGVGMVWFCYTFWDFVQRACGGGAGSEQRQPTYSSSRGAPL